MGQQIKVHCECGFETKSFLGGSRSSYLVDSSHPYYCESCGLVDCNVALSRDDFDKPVNCHKCKSEKITPYGTNALSKTQIENERRPSIDEHKSGNFCPKCRNYTLTFGPVIMLFD